MEKLNHEKFEALSQNELSRIEGGGWKPINVEVYKFSDGPCTTCTTYEKYNIFGNPTGKYEHVSTEDN
jgi:bacteriocin-like protein